MENRSREGRELVHAASSASRPASYPIPPIRPVADRGAAEPGESFEAECISGKIQAQHVRCGKPNCHCAHGELHGPYYYRIWRDGIRTRKVYVKPNEVDAVRAICEANASRMTQLRSIRQQRRQVCNALRGVWRTTQSLLR